jgi:hypothetical protein
MLGGRVQFSEINVKKSTEIFTEKGLSLLLVEKFKTYAVPWVLYRIFHWHVVRKNIHSLKEHIRTKYWSNTLEPTNRRHSCTYNNDTDDDRGHLQGMSP